MSNCSSSTTESKNNVHPSSRQSSTAEMVVHLSSKLGHIAQSLRPQHHLHSLRSAAFPSTHTHATPPGFFDPTNVFVNGTSASSAASAQTPPSANSNIVAERTSASAGAGHGGASTGGARGSKWHAGSRQPNWTFQVRATRNQTEKHVCDRTDIRNPVLELRQRG